MSSTDQRPEGQHPPHGSIGYLQVPALDLDRSATFYESVLGWSVDHENGGFEAPGMIGQLTTDEVAGRRGRPGAVDLRRRAVARARPGDGRRRARSLERPVHDGGERWLVTVTDPAGNRIGLVAAAGTPQSQTMLAVQDVEAASRWYQELLGLVSDHGGPEYERLTSGGRLVLQLHAADVEHHHGAIGTADGPVGGGVLVWFGEVDDFDDVVTRAAAARRTRRPGAAPQPARGQRPLAPRALDLRPRRLHGRGGQPGRRGLRAGLSTGTADVSDAGPGGSSPGSGSAAASG